MWPKFGNFSISMRQVIITSIQIWPEKPLFLKGGFGSSSIIRDCAGYGLEISHKCDKSVKSKSQKVLVINFDVCRNYTGKTGRPFCLENWGFESINFR